MCNLHACMSACFGTHDSPKTNPKQPQMNPTSTPNRSQTDFAHANIDPNWTPNRPQAHPKTTPSQSQRISNYVTCIHGACLYIYIYIYIYIWHTFPDNTIPDKKQLIWGQFWEGLGLILDRFGVDVGSFSGRFGIVLRSVQGRFGIDLGSVWSRFGVGSGSIWGRFVRSWQCIF